MGLYNLYNFLSLILLLAVIIGYINYRYTKTQTTIAITIGALIISLAIIIIGKLSTPYFEHHITLALKQIPFHDLVVNGMLSFLLFAGALRININQLKKQLGEIITLATFGVITSTLLIGFATYYLLWILGLHIDLIYCFLFGALISPTDPVAVIATFRETNAHKNLKIIIEGEALFNDGIALVIFLTIYQIAFTNQHIAWQTTLVLFLRQTIGGIIYGIILGYIAYRWLKTINEHKLEILITLVVATSGYAFAQLIHISGPLAMVTAGIFVGNKGRALSMSKNTIAILDSFWELIEEILNVILFALIGLELLIINIHERQIIAALLAIPLALLVRWIVVFIPISIFKKYRSMPRGTIRILTWGGLRGALTIALALILPASPFRDLILGMTYAIVIFAIVVQGITVEPLIRKFSGFNLY